MRLGSLVVGGALSLLPSVAWAEPTFALEGGAITRDGVAVATPCPTPLGLARRDGFLYVACDAMGLAIFERSGRGVSFVGREQGSGPCARVFASDVEVSCLSAKGDVTLRVEERAALRAERSAARNRTLRAVLLTALGATLIGGGAVMIGVGVGLANLDRTRGNEGATALTAGGIPPVVIGTGLLLWGVVEALPAASAQTIVATPSWMPSAVMRPAFGLAF